MTPKLTPPKLVVGGEQGIAAVDDSGKVIKVLSKTLAVHPRWTTDHQAIVFLSNTEVRKLQLDTATETVIAKLPATIAACPDTTIELSELSIQEDADFMFDKAGKTLCIRLQDRNINMAETIVSFEVELATGKTDPLIVMSSCPRKEKDEPGMGCTGQRTEPKATTTPVAKPFAIVKGKLVDHGKPKRKLESQGDFEEEAVSPSGRWAVIGGNRNEGDYIHRDLFLFDRDSGNVFPIPETAATWPAPIAATELPTIESWSGRTYGAVGETAIRWLGDGDMLVIGSELITPGTRVSKLDGDLAR